jgi:hypothetical protein
MAAYVSCPGNRPEARQSSGYSMVASDGFSTFTY